MYYKLQITSNYYNNKLYNCTNSLWLNVSLYECYNLNFIL